MAESKKTKTKSASADAQAASLGKAKTSKKSDSGQARMTSKAKGISMPVYDLAGKEKETIQVSEQIFGQKENNVLLSQYIRVYQTNQRQGTVSTKTRGEIVGTTKKMYRQKGTGRARHGSGKEHIFVGGGVAFGPKPRTFSKSLNKKQKKQALMIALSIKMRNKDIIGLDAQLASMKPKTKAVADFLKNTENDTKKILFVLPEMKKEGFVLSARNLKNVDMMHATTINPFSVLNHQKVVFVDDAVSKLENHFFPQDASK